MGQSRVHLAVEGGQPLREALLAGPEVVARLPRLQLDRAPVPERKSTFSNYYFYHIVSKRSMTSAKIILLSDMCLCAVKVSKRSKSYVDLHVHQNLAFRKGLISNNIHCLSASNSCW